MITLFSGTNYATLTIPAATFHPRQAWGWDSDTNSSIPESLCFSGKRQNGPAELLLGDHAGPPWSPAVYISNLVPSRWQFPSQCGGRAGRDSEVISKQATRVRDWTDPSSAHARPAPRVRFFPQASGVQGGTQGEMGISTVALKHVSNSLTFLLSRGDSE